MKTVVRPGELILNESRMIKVAENIVIEATSSNGREIIKSLRDGITRKNPNLIEMMVDDMNSSMGDFQLVVYLDIDLKHL